MQSNSEVFGGLVVGRMRDGRCRYDPQVKQELVGQCMLPGVSVARMAMQHGVNANLLRAWISKWKTKSQSSQAIRVRRAVSETATWDVQEVPAFVPVQVEAVAVSAADAPSAMTAMPTKACGAASKSAAISASGIGIGIGIDAYPGPTAQWYFCRSWSGPNAGVGRGHANALSLAMFALNPGRVVYLHRDAIDFRKNINGLASLVEHELGLDAFAQAVFVFSNRRRDRIKILGWDRNGFWLLQKRLEGARFVWPVKDSAVASLTVQQLHWLLEGIDLAAMRGHAAVSLQKAA